MLSKAQIKYIRSLQQKKLRHTHHVYVIEGEKMLEEYIRSNYPIHNIYATEEWEKENQDLLRRKNLHVERVSAHELEQVSSLTTPNKVIALAKMPDTPSEKITETLLTKGLHLALENMQDPGNLGTVIRTAEWFGVDSVICSEDCVDTYNAKAIQATMGSLARVKVFTVDLREVFAKSSLPVYAAVLNGENIFNQKLPKDAIVLIGNESKGISNELVRLAQKRISIPRFGKAESLNASIAAAVILALIRKG